MLPGSYSLRHSFQFCICSIHHITGNHDTGSSGKWRHCASKNVGVLEETLALTSNLIGRRVSGVINKSKISELLKSYIAKYCDYFYKSL